MFQARGAKLRTCLALLVVALLAAGLVACGSSSDSKSSSSTTGSSGDSGTKKPSGTPLKVGFITELSGAYAASFASTAKGAQAYVDYLNDHGGLAGHPVELKVYDTKSDPTQAINTARRAVADNLFAIVGASAYLDSAMPYLAEQKMPIVGWGISRNWYTPGTEDNVFSWVGKVVGKTTTSWADRILDAGNKKVAVTGDTSSGPDVVLDQWSQMVKDLGGQIVFRETSLDVSDAAALSAVAQKIIDSGAQAVMSTMGVGNVALQAALKQLGSKISVQSGGEYSPKVPEQFGSSADGYVVATFFAPFQSKGVPGLEDYFKIMDKYAPDSKEDVFAADGYISMRFFAEGFHIAGGDPTQTQYISAMESMNKFDMDGLVPPISFPAFHSEPATCLGFVTLKAGKWTPTGTSKPFMCGKVYPFEK